MPVFSSLTRERFAAYMFAWLTTLIALWTGIPVIRKGITDVLWQLYNFFLGK